MAKKAVKKTKTKLTREELVKIPLNVAKEISDIGTDIGDEPTSENIVVTGDQEAPSWLINLITITTHSFSLVETSLGKKVFGEFWTIIPGGRKLTISIQEAADAKVG